MRHILIGVVTCIAIFVYSLSPSYALDVTLAWDANAETNLAGYKVYYGTTAGGPYNGSGSSEGSSPIVVPLGRLTTRSSPEFTVHGLADGTYYFVATAYNTDGLESGYSNEAYTQGSSTPPANPPTNSAPTLSSLQVNGTSGSTTIYVNDSNRMVDIRIVASDDSLVSQYLILDGNSNANGGTFMGIPGGARQNPIFTVSDFVLNNSDGNHTIYAWVKDDKGVVSAAATKTNVLLDRVAPTVAISYSESNPVSSGGTITITANFTDSSPISGTPKISINYAGTGSDISNASMTQVSNKQWRYVITVPPGSEGTAVVTVTGEDASGNLVEGHVGNFFVVHDAASTAEASDERVGGGLVVLYDFTEGSGAVVHDVSGVGMPLDLTIQNPGAVSWLSGGGLSVNSATVIRSVASADKVIGALKASNALTVEAWIKPANTTQAGPARIVTCSTSPTAVQNFMVGTGLWGSKPTSVVDVRMFNEDLNTPVGTLSATDLTHVVFTRDVSGAVRVYIDGVQQLSGSLRGSFSSWNSSYPLVLGNEPTGNRPWLGEFHLVAIYDRALSQNEVIDNLQAGLTATDYPPVDASPVGIADVYHVIEGGSIDSKLDDLPGLLENDTDPEGDLLEAVMVDLPSNGSLTLYPDGSFIYSPYPGYIGIDSFIYQAFDGTSHSAATTVTINVTSINAPEASYERVGDGLVVLYDFTEGSGAVVHDVSGIGMPLDLTIQSPGAVSWLSGGGLSVNSSGVISSMGSAGKVTAALKASNAFTVEAWIKAANATQSGPARIVTSSSDPTAVQNFMVGAGSWGSNPSNVIDVRLFNQELITGAGTLTTALSHVVYTREAGGAVRVYIDGVQRLSTTLAGSLSVWNDSYPLVLGNEPTGNRPWLGEFHLVAIYDRALSKEEVALNFSAAF